MNEPWREARAARHGKAEDDGTSGSGGASLGQKRLLHRAVRVSLGDW
jgi:hypothetical protein